jgi:hypothetical protein
LPFASAGATAEAGGGTGSEGLRESQSETVATPRMASAMTRARELERGDFMREKRTKQPATGAGSQRDYGKTHVFAGEAGLSLRGAIYVCTIAPRFQDHFRANATTQSKSQPGVNFARTHFP